jgi:hypothetical protein
MLSGFNSSKMCIYLSLVTLVVTYGWETWLQKNIREKQLRAFERKVTRKAHGSWRVRTNEETDLTRH